MWNWFHKLASPPHFYRLAGIFSPWLLWSSLILIAIGTYGGLVLAPADYQQGEGFRIIYVHVPSSYLSTMIYALMAITSGIGLIWRIKLAHAVAASAAPIGASFTVVSLLTGMLWGKPMWGTYWEWDPRLTSELILLFIYFGYMSLRASFEDIGKADRAGGLLAVVGVVNLPIIHYSVIWWSSLHQGPSIKKLDAPSISGDMLWPLLLLIAASTLFFGAILLYRARAEVLDREHNSRWVQDLLGERPGAG
ncbi:MAG: heme ABC transporter permease CcmC [Gammaproteobacteria bacterium]|jgi:heme exporter protein C|nr:heme ABC transporter permease [Chromatiales bacterium]MCP4927358.1 cytochrome c biogenesis protein CcsA [Gammaproteobacteria bacterium]MDP7153928.1 heme ABC transporter permease CcmC [Gammaproteobacteria bacterium]MDP7296030.1 heme ABC transporter permease CcmC [Gammaproteobacteria bacterium]MDP7419355.1 heme ABC transporter permease CcmC [Gammaproteobacteria bacterium]